MTEIFLDTETTGLSVNNKDRIVEIACVETNNLTPTKRIFHKIINPQRDVPDGAWLLLRDREDHRGISKESKLLLRRPQSFIRSSLRVQSVCRTTSRLL